MRHILFSLSVLASISSCSNNSENKVVDVQKTKYPTYYFNNGSDSILVEVKKTPEKAVTFSQFSTEMLLALGLGDKIIVGTTEGDIYPKFQGEFEKVKKKLLGHHALYTKEEFLLSGADFVTGWDDGIRAETTGTPEELIRKGIYPFIAKSVRDFETLDTVYEDFETLGRIFNVEKKAQSVVADMKHRLSEAEKTFVKNPSNKKLKVLVFSAIGNGVYVSSGLTTDLISRAGGENVYAELGADHVMVSYESLVHRNPDIILIANMEGVGYEEKKRILKEHPALQNLPAVKNDYIYPMSLGDISPGVRNVDFIINLNKLLYGRKD